MTVYAFASVNHATYGGVYYCANFTTSGAITWTKLTTTGLASTEITHFRVDYGDPLNRQFVMLSNDEIYARNGGNWTKILDVSIAGAVAGGPGTPYDLSWLYTDPTTPGSVYSLYMTDPSPYDQGICFVMKSLDYGATWAAYQFRTGRDRIKAVEAIGDDIWASAGKQVIANSGIYYSADGGSSWNNTTATAGSSSTAVIRINPHTPNKAFVWGDGGRNEWTFSGGSFSNRVIATLDTGDSRADYVWVDPVTAGRTVYVKGGHIYSSSDYFANVTDTAIADAAPCGIIGPFNIAGNNGLIFGMEGPAGGSSTVGYLTGETDAAADERGGANVGSIPYTDSVPGVIQLSEYGLWWGTPAAGKGVFVYADELGDITNIPSYDGLGAPMFGDRASWRDRKTDGFDIYHAEDVERDERQIHAPQPTGNDGYGIVEVGGYWVNSSDVMVTGLGGGLTVTEIDGVPSIAATTLEFPNGTVTDEGGGVARYTPTIPAHALDDHTDVDLTGTGTGDIIYNNAATWEDYPLGIGTNVVNDGSEIKLGDVSGGNYVNIDTGTGELSLVGTATAFEDIQVTLTIRDTGATTYNPSFSKWFDDAAGTSRGCWVYGFDDHHTNEKELFFTCQFRHAQKLNALIHPHVHWIGKTSQNSKKVQWGLEYTWKSPGQVYGDTVFEYANTPISGNVNITAGLHEITEFADLLPDDTCNDLSSILIGRLFRNSSNTVNDTYTDDVGLLAIDFHVEINSFGSNQEYSKTEPTPPPAPSQGIIPVQVFGDLDNMTGPLLDDGSDKLENEIMS